MENLVPPLLIAVQEVRWRLASGSSMKESVRNYLDNHEDEFALRLREHWTLKNQTGATNIGRSPFQTHYQRAFWELIERGCDGQPVLDPLTSLEQEVLRACQRELEVHILSLPFKMLIPLLFFQFPAHLLLLLLPLLRDLSQQLEAR